MVSAQIAGSVRIYIESADGRRVLVKSATTYWFAPGGSSDSVIANTPEKWNFMPISPVVGKPGSKIVVAFASGAAATTDASDGVWTVPVQVGPSPNGPWSQLTFGNAANAAGVGNDNFVVDRTPADDALIANNEGPIQVLRAKEGVFFRVGGDRVWLSIENNA